MTGARLLRRGPLELDFAHLRQRRDHALAKLDKMVEFAERDWCRRRAILEYFGESADYDKCGTCANRSQFQLHRPGSLPPFLSD